MSEPSSASTRAVFVSDLHFGAAGTPAEREAQFVDFLRRLDGRISHLFILGDLFEFWMEYRHFVPKHHFAVLSQLHQLSYHDVEIHYQCGNHDFNLGDFFQDQLGITVHHEPWICTLDNKRILLLHGDGLALPDWKYRLAKKVLHNPIANAAFKILHPDLGMSLALGVGSSSRKMHKPAIIDDYRPAAQKLLADYSADVLIHGHTHELFIEDMDGHIYANSGEWVEKRQYLVFEDGKLVKHNYS